VFSGSVRHANRKERPITYSDFAHTAFWGLLIMAAFVLLGGMPPAILFWMGVVVAIGIWRARV